MASTLSLPFAGVPSSSFGRRWLNLGNGPFRTLHDGTDWPTGYDTPLPAMGNGVIVDKLYTALRGYQVVVQHDADRLTGYNLMRGESPLAIGSQVSAGQTIGLSGPHPGWETSGAAATGPHTHAWLKERGQFEDMRARLIYRNFADIATLPLKQRPPEEETEMIIQISTPQKDNPKAVDWWLLNPANHTYSHVPNLTQVKFNKNIGIKTYENQAPSVMAGYTKI